MKKFRLLITGSRTWDDYDLLKTKIIETIADVVEGKPELRSVPLSSWFNIIHGNCPKGADMLADHFARTVLGLNPEIYEADWRVGRHAGFLRNSRMVESMPDACLAFIRDKSKGATGCRDLAKKKGIATETVTYELTADSAPIERKGL